jgi:hypothetical protein
VPIAVVPWTPHKYPFFYLHGNGLRKTHCRCQNFTCKNTAQSGSPRYLPGQSQYGQDTLYFMPINSSRNNQRILRYTSMSRRRHLGSNIARDRRERFIKHRDNIDDIRAGEQRLTQTNTHTTYTTDFDHICFCTGRSRQCPRSSLQKPNVSKNKMEDLDRETKRLFPLG